jgi:hypothetical protein
MSITLPVAMQKDGSPIIGPAMEELLVDDSMTSMGALTYPAATLDTSQADLTVRAHQEDPRIPISEDDWQYVDAQTIQLLPAGTRFEQGMLYELVYLAKNPSVSGLSFAGFKRLLKGAAPLRPVFTSSTFGGKCSGHFLQRRHQAVKNRYP